MDWCRTWPAPENETTSLGHGAEKFPGIEEHIFSNGERLGSLFSRGSRYSTALENLASLYQLQGLFEKAEPLLEESLEIDRRLLGEDHTLYSTTLHNLASLYKELEKYD